jgi:Flp pilus assembly protein TadD/SAM-dependent methyltransferase
MSDINRAVDLHRAGHLDDAAVLYRQILARDPNHADASHLLGLLTAHAGDTESAARLIAHAIHCSPHVPDYHNNLGEVLRALGRFDHAIAAYRQALKLKPDYAIFHNNLGLALQACGRLRDAIAAFLKAAQLRPRWTETYRELVNALRLYQPTSYEADIEQALITCFQSHYADHQYLARLAANQIKYKHGIGRDSPVALNQGTLTVQQLATDELLISLLSRTINIDPDLELLLAELRRQMLLGYSGSASISETDNRFVVALALQCHNNEYVFAFTPDEIRIVGQLRESCEGIDHDSAVAGDKLEKLLLLLSLYLPLSTLRCVRKLAAINIETWHPVLQPLIRRALKEPLEEHDIEGNIERFGVINDATSQAVGAQYQQNPYPRWVDVPPYEQTSLSASLRRAFPHFKPADCLEGPVHVLVAGCGTGREAITIALNLQNAKVVAIDLSRSSLAYATRMARELCVKDVRFLQGDLLNVTALGTRVHLVACTGVLHHLQNPVQGWRTLLEILEPGGVMRIGLYSATGRSVIDRARDQIQRLGLSAVEDDIRNFRRLVLTGALNGELTELIERRDLYTLSSCRDLLFHVKEHRFTLPEIDQLLAELGLRFIGFELPTATIAQRYQRLFPGDPRMTRLSNWDEFERLNPRAFSTMYTFWCEKPTAG